MLVLVILTKKGFIFVVSKGLGHGHGDLFLGLLSDMMMYANQVSPSHAGQEKGLLGFCFLFYPFILSGTQLIGWFYPHLGWTCCSVNPLQRIKCVLPTS